jgi:predicted nucleic acid-binding protein
MPEYKILIDTNIFISAEDYQELSPELAELLKILEKNRHIICIHPASLEDLEIGERKEEKSCGAK